MTTVLGAITLTALIARFLVNLCADLLNIGALRAELPSEFEGVYSAQTYRRSQEYLKTTTRFGLVTATFSLSALVAFWGFGGFDILDRTVREFGGTPVAGGILYIGILAAGYSLLMLPFEVYATFVIEERFGFNRTTWSVFIMDRVKGLFLGVLLGGSLLAGVLSLFQYVDGYAWLYAWMAVTAFVLTAQFVAPRWIMSLFNKFVPMQPGETKDAILDYAHSVGFKVDDIMVMDGSRRSTKSNAFFSGFGRNKRIALFDTLINAHSTPELVAVLAHEIGHYKKRHILQGIIINILYTGLALFLLSVFLHWSALYKAFYITQPSVYTGLVCFGLFYTPVEMLLSVAMQLLSRRNEYAADRYAADTIDDPEEIVKALKKLSSANLSNLMPHPFYVFLNYSHPPLLDRVRAIHHDQASPGIEKEGRQSSSR